MKLTQWWALDHQLWHLAMCRIFYGVFWGTTQLLPNKEELWFYDEAPPGHIHWGSFWSKRTRVVIVNWFTLSLWAAMSVCVIMCVSQLASNFLLIAFMKCLPFNSEEVISLSFCTGPLYVLADCISFWQLSLSLSDLMCCCIEDWAQSLDWFIPEMWTDSILLW